MSRYVTRSTIPIVAIVLSLAGPAFAQGAVGGPAKQTGLGGATKQTSPVPTQKGIGTVATQTQNSNANSGKKTKK